MSPTSSRTNSPPDFLFFGGKGGVGKTTCAAAHAVSAAAAGRRVLLVSTDPAHSLGDALNVRLGAAPRAVPLRGVPRRGQGALYAVELDAPRAFRRWLAEHRRALGDVVEHGTWLDRSDVDALLGLSVPGIDELVGLVEIRSLSTQARYDLIVVDTAPTGHTLRMVGAPDAVAAVANLLDTLQESHRLVRARFAGISRPEAADRVIELIAGQARDSAALLHDRQRTAFCWVTLPELLSLAESEDGLAALEESGIAVPTVVVNRVLPGGPRCPRCDPRRAEESRVIVKIRRRLGRGRRVTTVAAVQSEPRGVKALASLGTFRGEGDRVVRSKRAASRVSTPPLSLEAVIGGARLVFVGGKGGVGKTTVAAATALAAAEAHRDREVLLISTDPAHSLADVLQAEVGDRPAAVDGGPANLRVQEIDAARALRARRAALQAAVHELVTTFGTGDAGRAGGRGVGELLELAPPGIDELFGLLEIVRGATGGAKNLLIVDTAPTGHALRLLEMPAIARDWMQLLMRVLLKYREIVRPGALGAELMELSRSLRALQELLHDRRAARFVVVTRGAALPRLETGRLISRLRRLRLAVVGVVVNAATNDPGGCPWCRSAAAADRAAVTALRAAAARGRARWAIIAAPIAAPPPRGVRALSRWARSWIA